MRPDEHKKKKNAAYKKKHGITDKEVSNRKEENSGKGCKAEEGKAGVDEGKKAWVAAGQKGQQLRTDDKGSSSKQNTKTTSKGKVENMAAGGNSSSNEFRYSGAARLPARGGTASPRDSSSSDECEPITGADRKFVKKSYSRRQIVSNWTKYELQEEAETDPSPRGESYEKLLSLAGDAISHFRFKDELAWDGGKDVSGDADSSDIYSQLLSIDTAELERSLSCLPISQILGLSHDVFPAEQLAAMKNVAESNRQVLKATQSSRKTSGSSPPAYLTDADDMFNSFHIQYKQEKSSCLSSGQTLQGPDHISLVKSAKHKPENILLTPKRDPAAQTLVVTRVIDHRDLTCVVTPANNQTQVVTSASNRTQDVILAKGTHNGKCPADIVLSDTETSQQCDQSPQNMDEKMELQDEDLDELLDSGQPTDEFSREMERLRCSPRIKESSKEKRQCEPSEQASGNTDGSSVNTDGSPVNKDGGSVHNNGVKQLGMSTVYKGEDLSKNKENDDLEAWLDSVLDS